MSETPHELNQSGDIKYNFSMPPVVPGDIENFFNQKELENPAYKGFSACAYRLARAIRDTSRNAGKKQRKEIVLALTPEAKLDFYRFHTNQGTEASVALMELAYQLTGAKLKFDETTEENPTGRIIWQGKNAGQPVNFIEYYTMEKGERVMHWTLSSTMPDDLATKIPLPIGEQMRMTDEVRNDIRTIYEGDYSLSDLEKAA